MSKKKKNKQKEEEKGFVSILSDYGFKITFGDETDTRFLHKVIMAVLDENWGITDFVFGNSVFSGISVRSRGGIYDITFQDDKKNMFVLEMQLKKADEFIHRVQFYLFHVLNKSIKKGKYKFKNLKPNYFISFIGYNIVPHLEEYYHIAKIKNQHGDVIDDLISYIIIEISKFDKEEDKLETELDKLIYFMKYTSRRKGTEEIPQFIKDDKILFETLLKLDQSNMSLDEIMDHEITLANMGSQIGTLERLLEEKEEAEQKQGEGEQEKVEAEQEKAEAEKEVLEAKKRAEKAEAGLRQGVKNLLSMGHLTEIEIARTLGVTVEFVEAIKNERLP